MSPADDTPLSLGGAVFAPSGQALAASPSSPVPCPAPLGFDPSRVMEAFYLSRYYEPKATRPADNVLAAIEYVRDLYVEPATQEIARISSLASWAARRLPPLWEKHVMDRLTAQGMAARSDETGTGSAVGNSPVAESDAPKASSPKAGAQTTPPPSSHKHQEQVN